MDKIKVLIVDDHYMFIRGIVSIIKDDESLEIVGEAHNGREAYEQARRLKPDVILMDVNMPILDGLGALKIIIKDMPEMKILMLTVNEKDQNLFEAMKNGAKGYLLKDLLPNELLTFIHMVNRGESIISGPMAMKIVDYFSKKEKQFLSPTIDSKMNEVITRREKEILMQVIKGLTNREIAEVLYISENTVKNHLRNIMEKLHMNNRVQAAAYALQEGWLHVE